MDIWSISKSTLDKVRILSVYCEFDSTIDFQEQKRGQIIFQMFSHFQFLRESLFIWLDIFYENSIVYTLIIGLSVVVWLDGYSIMKQRLLER